MFPVQITINNPTELAKVLAALGFNSQPQAELPLTIIEPKAEAKKPKATPAPQPVVEAPAPTPAVVEPAPVEAAAPAPAAESPSSVDYPTLQKAVFALAGKSREAAAAVAQSFGVKTFKELDASKWGDALAAVNAALAA